MQLTAALVTKSQGQTFFVVGHGQEKTATKQTMAAGFTAAFASDACVGGVERDISLFMRGLTEDSLSDQDSRIPVAAYHALNASAIRPTGDTALLERHRLESWLETMSVLAQIVHTPVSLGPSIAQLNRYLHLMTEANLPLDEDGHELLRTDADLWIVDPLVVLHDAYIGIAAFFAWFTSEFRRSFQDATFEIGMEITNPPPPSRADQYPDLFRVPVQFNASR